MVDHPEPPKNSNNSRVIRKLFDNWGVLLIVAVLLVDRGVAHLKTQGMDLGLLCQQTADLHEWHDMRDSEGVMLWYVRRSLEEAIVKLADNIGEQTRVLNRIDVNQAALTEVVGRMREDSLQMLGRDEEMRR
jgi:hypothetical protein